MRLKKIVSGTELQEKMQEAITLLCDTVKETLGPVGNNTIIDHSTFSPFITNDGVTIAKNIESDDPVINTILELAKEAAIKTDETVGDGTTTTLVLLESIFLDGLEKIKNGKKAMILKNELNNSLKKVIALIKEKNRIPEKDDLFKIASISSNDPKIGEILTNTFIKVKDTAAIKLIDNNTNKTEVNFYKGYRFETLLASPYFLKNEKISFNNSKILISNQEINDLEEIAKILNEIIEKQNNLIIIANDYSEDFIQSILSLYLNNTAQIILLKNPLYGENSYTFLEDISIITNAKARFSKTNLNRLSLGLCEHVEITNEKTTLQFTSNENIKLYKKNIKKDETEYGKKRLAMFTNGLAEIKIGGLTETEIREKHMRYQDALCSLNVAKKGILPGSGITLLEIKEELNIESDGDEILKNSLDKPFIQILKNAALNDQEISKEIKKNNYKILYNVSLNKYENKKETSVIDSTEVILNSIMNACSIASMLLTTSNLVINEYQNNLNKQNEYNEFI